jgi:hypothetical protein
MIETGNRKLSVSEDAELPKEISIIYNADMVTFTAFLHRQRWVIGGIIGIIAVMAGIEYGFGRSPLGPDGRFGWWDSNIWGNENSQRVADVYSFSHIIHGMIFYGLLFIFARQLPVRQRFLLAALMEAGWELLENSPIIINRYREATIAQGYVGDSILNSSCDVLMAALGFWLAYRLSLRVILAAILVMEVGCLLWVRDNLTLNIIMLVHPSELIKHWQAAGQPGL